MASALLIADNIVWLRKAAFQAASRHGGSSALSISNGTSSISHVSLAGRWPRDYWLRQADRIWRGMDEETPARCFDLGAAASAAVKKWA